MSTKESQAAVDYDKTKELFEKLLERTTEFVTNISPELIKEYAKQEYYLRIDSSGYRAVSLNDKSPLLGYSEAPCDNLEKAIESFSSPLVKSKENRERNWVQAKIIKKALLDNLSLKIVKIDAFDELFFAFDELPLVDDEGTAVKLINVLCVGRKGSEDFPVLLKIFGPGVNICDNDELGYSGAVKRLEEWRRYLVDERLKESFRSLLKARTGLDVNASRVLKVAAFPEYNRKSKGAKDMIKAFRDNDILAVEYQGNGGYFSRVKTGMYDAEY